MINRKHYKAIAEIIRKEDFSLFRTKGTRLLRTKEFTENLAGCEVVGNPRFDRDKFFKAAGIEE